MRYVALGLLLIFLTLYLLCECEELKKLGLKSWLKEGWTMFLLLHLCVLLCFLASFVAVQIVALLAPKLELTAADDGYYEISGTPTASDDTGFFQLINDYHSLFRANFAAQQACIFLGALAAVTGCILITRLAPSTTGIGIKSLQMTFRKTKFYILACSLGLLIIVLIFVSFGDISFGDTTSSFAGYYESLKTSAAFLLGGTIGNYDVYSLTSINSVFSGLYFVPLFLLFSVFGFTFLVAMVLTKYNCCAQNTEQNVTKYKLNKQGLFRTRYEWFRYALKKMWMGFWKEVCRCRSKEKLEILAEDEFEDDIREAQELKASEERKKGQQKRTTSDEHYCRRATKEETRSSAEEFYESPPQYPSWVWNEIGMKDPLSIYATNSGTDNAFYVDAASMAEYSKTYGYFNGFDVVDYTTSGEGYFTPKLAVNTAQKAPAPSIAKVYLLVRHQMQKDHQDAWKKLFVVVFLVVVIATITLQVGDYSCRDNKYLLRGNIASQTFNLSFAS
ncbi:hypothetical protein, conserved [Eimeria tenella]|uniref:Polycystin cation channel PKD1/PKD2 domain-containing protein n=1 Tax=Eimeria tenella TaxID=5802 RepID=U6KG97_EIMTE|nr:hypothetical protein, conserved [Eimeria tenella]CDJ36954.1 hypothetical protein, conserved [Eimeria tenella]|eukprot:XP_013227792.1 hypothetical protein, conserved [Eimeria tenella]